MSVITWRVPTAAACLTKLPLILGTQSPQLTSTAACLTSSRSFTRWTDMPAVSDSSQLLNARRSRDNRICSLRCVVTLSLKPGSENGQHSQREKSHRAGNAMCCFTVVSGIVPPRLFVTRPSRSASCRRNGQHILVSVRSLSDSRRLTARQPTVCFETPRGASARSSSASRFPGSYSELFNSHATFREIACIQSPYRENVFRRFQQPLRASATSASAQPICSRLTCSGLISV